VLGKMVALLAFMAVAPLVAEALTFVASVLIAPGQGIDTSAGYSVNARGANLGDTRRPSPARRRWRCTG
jgi:hypothetical protein